ncbi:hypothetical protein CXL00_12130 [Stutzerimonas stutzeri]|uniref:Phosphotransferase n=1 Tax=Stutzerimonas stutzeri TaxID=316 RepID=A0A2N8SSK1_STUST|nr:hypothetical protein CXL00_12130 [Stutzerimonas stutzeri]
MVWWARSSPKARGGGRRLEAGGWRLEAGGWRLEAGQRVFDSRSVTRGIVCGPDTQTKPIQRTGIHHP